MWTILGCKVLLISRNSTFLAMYLWSLVFSILCFQNINHTSTFSWNMPKILHILNQVLTSILLALLFIAISGFRCKVFIKVYLVEERIIGMYEKATYWLCWYLQESCGQSKQIHGINLNNILQLFSTQGIHTIDQALDWIKVVLVHTLASIFSEITICYFLEWCFVCKLLSFFCLAFEYMCFYV